MTYRRFSYEGMTLYSSENRREYRVKKRRESFPWLLAQLAVLTAIIAIVAVCAKCSAPTTISILAAVSTAPIAAVHFV